MAKEIIENYSKYFFIASFIGITLLSIYLIKSYIITIISAILLAYIFFPVYKIMKKAVRKRWLSSLITIILVVLVIIIPIIFAANALITESLLFFHQTKDLDLSKIEASIAPYIDKEIELNKVVTNTLNDFSLSIARGTQDFVFSLPKKILGLFVMLFLMYYLFLNGKGLIEKIKGHIPLKERQKDELSKRFNSVIYASIYGIIVTAFIQGAIAALGFWIFGISSPILWGLVSVVAAILPFIGASLVWLPAAIIKLATGETFNGLGLLFYGIFIISTIDNVIRPGIVGSKGKIHPALVLLGVLGGLELFGFLGIIIGPLILSILTIFLDLYLLEKTNKRPKLKKRV
jgi:predicted PurR-regulated permease PerM